MSAEAQIPAGLLAGKRYGTARVALGKLLYWRYKVLRGKRHNDVVLEQVAGFPLVVLPSVLNPKAMRTGEFFASQLQIGGVADGADVLDMGTGSGVCAVAAARHARRVVAVDINPAAVRCARINALMNGLESKIDVLHGDLFAPVTGRRFDLVLFNPPFMRGVPRDDADRAWRSVDVAERFAAGLREHLTASGTAVIMVSTYGDAAEFLRQFRRWNFDIETVSERSFINERLTLLRLRPAPGG